MRMSKRRKDVPGEIIAYPGASSLTFEKAIAAFTDGQDAAGRSKVTISDYTTVVCMFLRFMADKHNYTSVEHVHEADILGWLAHLRNSVSSRGIPYSSRSIATYSIYVRVFFRWLVEHRYLAVDPTAFIMEPKVDKPLIRVFTQDELERLDAACDRAPFGKSITPDERKMLAARDRAILWLLLSTGIRRSELCGLRFCDIDWDKGLITVMGKGAKERRVPIGSVARQHLNTYIMYWRGTPAESDEKVFLTVFGKPIGRMTIENMFARLKKGAGITDKRVSAHTCRHWFAVNCIKNGMPSTVLQGLLGHEQLEMINTYVRLAEQDNRDLYVRYSPVDGLEMHHSTKDRRKRARDWRNSRRKSKGD